MKQMQQQQWMNAMSSVVTIPVPVTMKMPQQPQVQVPFGYQLVRQEKPMLEDLLPGQTRGVRRRNSRPKRAESQIGGSQSSKVFVGGLSPHSTAETLRAHFEKFGVITDCAVINEPGTRKSRGSASWSSLVESRLACSSRSTSSVSAGAGFGRMSIRRSPTK